MAEATASPVPARPAWHRHAHRRFRHSVKARLVALFLLLAFGMTSAFLFGTQRALTVGWRDAARPLLADYVDRLADEIGSPPSRDRAKALAQRLPVRIRISGPSLNWQSGDFVDEDEHRYWRRRETGLFHFTISCREGKASPTPSHGSFPSHSDGRFRHGLLCRGSCQRAHQLYQSQFRNFRIQ